MLDLGLAILAMGIGWLAIWLFDHSSRIAAWGDHGATDVLLAEAHQ